MEENIKRSNSDNKKRNNGSRNKSGNSSNKASQRGKSSSASGKSRSVSSNVSNNRRNGKSQTQGKNSGRQNSRNRQNNKENNRTQNGRRTINENFKPWDLEDDVSNKKRQFRGHDFTSAIKDSVGKMSQKVLNNDAPDETVILNESDLKAEFDDGLFVDEYALKKKKRKIIKERREGKKKPVKIKEPLSKRQRKIRNIVVSAAIMGVVLIVGVILSLTVLFTCENIEVQGVTKYKQEDVINKSGLTTGENLFLSDRTTAENNIKKAFPYIEEVKVSVKVPNTMEISVTEAVPAYFIKDGKDYIVISDKGRLLEHTDVVTGSVPVITGCKLTSNKIGDYAEVADQTVMPVLNDIAASLINNKVKGIKEINLSDMANVKLNYEDRINIILGVPENIDYKIRIAMKIINENLALTDKGELDVSNSKGENNASYFKPDLSVEEPTTPTNATESTEPVTNPEDFGDTNAGDVPDDYNWTEPDNSDYSGDDYSGDDDYSGGDDYSGDDYSGGDDYSNE